MIGLGPLVNPELTNLIGTLEAGRCSMAHGGSMASESMIRGLGMHGRSVTQVADLLAEIQVT